LEFVLNKKVVYVWIFSIIFMGAVASYQRLTGPTHPKNGKIDLAGTEISFSLLRSFGGPGDAEIIVIVPKRDITGKIILKRYKSHDEWTESMMTRSGDTLKAYLPHQSPAGKIMYEISLSSNGSEYQNLTKEPVVLRFKGGVPDFVLIPHIFLMFLAMIFSTRTALEAIFKWNNTHRLAFWTLMFFICGGMILGPIVQYYAFGYLWTGWPMADGMHLNLFKFGDLTDNKTLAALIMWAIAVWRLKKHPDQTYWAWIAAAVLLAVYMIPHSVLGSEIDYTQLPK
jgi:uncharacterized membrane protein